MCSLLLRLVGLNNLVGLGLANLAREGWKTEGRPPEPLATTRDSLDRDSSTKRLFNEESVEETLLNQVT